MPFSFFDMLIKLLEYRGHKISTRENATSVVIREVELDLLPRESSNRVFNTEGSWRTSQLIPNGKLHLKTGQHSWDKQWLENKKGLDCGKTVACQPLGEKKRKRFAGNGST